jgi:hypothetical protein
MFLQIGKRYIPFKALHQLFPTLPIIWGQVAAKRFLKNPRWWPFKIKKNAHRPKTRGKTFPLLPISTHRSSCWTIPLICAV